MMLHVVPLAAGAAVSPAVLGASLELLAAFKQHGRRMLFIYLAGAALVVVAVLALAILLPQRPQTRGDRLVSDVVDLALGALLLAFAVVLIVRRPKPRKDSTNRLLSSRWVWLGVLGLGLFMMATNLSTLVLLLAGSHVVHSSHAGGTAALLGYGILVVGALLPILLPLCWALISPASASRVLGGFSAVIAKHSRVIGIVVCLLTAAYLLLRGFGVL